MRKSSLAVTGGWGSKLSTEAGRALAPRTSAGIAEIPLLCSAHSARTMCQRCVTTETVRILEALNNRAEYLAFSRVVRESVSRQRTDTPKSLVRTSVIKFATGRSLH